ncbi:MAG: hypothetical protein KJ077_38025 [Anaerolineae bacterium]|nr:hypothetical protein [Anaerolineae bacterium]
MNVHNPIQLVRDADMQFVQHFIENVGSYSILNVFSTRRVGRTTFLRHIRDEQRTKMPTVFVSVQDFVSVEREGGYRLDQFLRQVADQLQSQLPADTISPVVEIETADRVNILALTVIELVNFAARKGSTPLILIDDYDLLPAGSKIVFEDLVLSRIVEQPGQAIVILSSEQELRFTDRLDLRVRLRTYELSRLTVSDIARSVPQRYAVLAPEILRWTGGMPDLVEFFVEEANKQQIGNLDEYRTRKNELLGPKYRTQIQKVVFPDIRTASDGVLDTLALLRRFDVAILSGVLPQINPKIFASFKQKHYLDLIRELGSRIYWREQGGYVLDDILKTMLSSYIRTFEPDTYRKVNDIVATTYEAWLREEYRQHYLLEMLYHRMILENIRISSDEVVTDLLSKLLLDYIEGRQGIGPSKIDELDSLRRTLEIDLDLRPFVEPEVFDIIDRMLTAKS